MRTRYTGIVMSYLFIVIARANWHKGDLHYWITAVNIDISPPGIHGLACKKNGSLFSMTEEVFKLPLPSEYWKSK